MFPSEGTDMPSVEEAQVVEYVDDLLVNLPLKEKILIRSLITLLEVQSLVFNGTRPKLFTNASSEERVKNLASWEKSSLFERRMVFMAIRTLLLWGYLDSQEVEEGMGFVPGTKRTKERQAAARAAAQRAIRQARGEEPVEGDPLPAPSDSAVYDSSPAGS